MSMMGNAVGMAAAGSIGLAAWNGPPPSHWYQPGGVSDLLYRPTWTGDSSADIPMWPSVRPTFPAPPDPQDEMRRHEELMEALRRLAGSTLPPVPAPTQAAPAAAPEPEGINTEDSFRPQRKLDIE